MMNAELIRQIDARLDGALVAMSQQDARTPALQLLWLAQIEAEKRGLLNARKRRTRERIHNPPKPNTGKERT